MKTININGHECVTLEEACKSMLGNVNEDLFKCIKKVNNLIEVFESIEDLKEEQHEEN